MASQSSGPEEEKRDEADEIVQYPESQAHHNPVAGPVGSISRSTSAAELQFEGQNSIFHSLEQRPLLSAKSDFLTTSPVLESSLAGVAGQSKKQK